MKDERKKKLKCRAARTAAAVMGLGILALGSLRVQAEPENQNLAPLLDDSILESLQNYDGEGKMPSPSYNRWNNYTVNGNAAMLNSILPEKYDLRTDHSLSPVPEIRNQWKWGTCWTFGSLASIESNAVIQGAGNADSIDYSELFLAWFASEYNHGEGRVLDSDNENMKLMQGGYTQMTLADTAAWTGPVEESLVPYQNKDGVADTMEGDWSVSEEIRDQTPQIDTVHVQNMDMLPETAVFTDWDSMTGYSLDQNAVTAVKNALMENGIVDVSYYAGEALPEEYGGYTILNEKTFSHYSPVWMEANHEVSIVGWDDTFSGTNFAVEPTDDQGNVLDGAWIVRNSWGKGYEDNSAFPVDKDGYFYISYYDRTITDFNSFQVDVKDTYGEFEYDHNYQYDYLGAESFTYFTPDEETYDSRVANVFEAGSYETLRAVSATTSVPGCQVDIEIYKLDEDSEDPQDGNLVLSQTETIPYSGYHTIPLDEEILLNPGQKFAVVERITIGQMGCLAIEIGTKEPIDMGNYQLLYTACSEEGQSFLGTPDGDGTYTWTDTTDMEPLDLGNGYIVEFGNVMIKAFTSDRVPRSDGTVTVDIVHTNDIHGRSGYEENSVFGFEKLAAYTDMEDPDLVIDAGDLYHGQAFATLEQGGSIAELVKAAGYDIVTPGNHDWNYGKERLKELADLSGVQMLAGNITQDGENFFGNDGTFIKEITEDDGDTVKVGVLAVFDQDIKDDTAPSNIEDLSFTDDAETATALAEKLKEQGCQIIVAVSHQQDCEDFLAETSGIDVLIAGHEHAVIDQSYPDRDGNQVKVVETGAYMENVGHLTLTYDIQTGAVSQIEETIVSSQEAANLTSDPEVASILARIRARQQEQLSQVVGVTGRDLDGRWENVRIEETGMGRLVTAAYLEETGADVAFENAGGIRTGRILEAGNVTYQDVIDTAPFGNYIVTKEITGKDLLEILEKSIELGRQNKKSYDEWIRTGSDQVRWPDNSGSYLQFAGVSVKYDMSKPEGKRVIEAMIGSEKVDPDRIYTIATNNYVALGDDYESLKNAPEINQYGACDEVLIRFFQKGQEAVDAATGTAWLQAYTGDENVTSSQKPEDTADGTPSSGYGEPSQKGDKTQAVVDTGDVENPALWGLVMVLAAVTGLTVGAYGWKRRGKKN